MVFSPVPFLIEAGSTSTEKPNAIVLSGGSADRLAEAAGAGRADKAASQEIGRQPLTPAAVEAVKKDLKANPPQPFDVARALRVFTSRVQYVEIEIETYRLSGRRVELPQELLDITDDRLRNQISGRLRPPANLSGPFKIKVETSKGEKSVNVDEKWLSNERKRIEGYTFVVPKFGRIVLSTERAAFDNEIERFKRNLAKYHETVVNAFEKAKSDLEKSLVKEYLPRWRKRPPSRFLQYGIEASPANLKRELVLLVQQVIREAVLFDQPRVRVVYKNVSLLSRSAIRSFSNYCRKTCGDARCRSQSSNLCLRAVTRRQRARARRRLCCREVQVGVQRPFKQRRRRLDAPSFSLVSLQPQRAPHVVVAGVA